MVFAGEKEDVVWAESRIWQITPQDISDLRAAARISGSVLRQRESCCLLWSMGNGLDDVRIGFQCKEYRGIAGRLEAAKYLERTYGTPYETGYPLVDQLVYDIGIMGKRYLL